MSQIVGRLDGGILYFRHEGGEPGGHDAEMAWTPTLAGSVTYQCPDCSVNVTIPSTGVYNLPGSDEPLRFATDRGLPPDSTTRDMD